MIPLKGNEIFGNWATLLLPINADDTIDFARLEHEIDTLIAMKVNGIYSNGTAGEFYNQTDKEFEQVNTLLAEKCNAANMPFQIGCSHMSPVVSLHRIQKAVSLKPSAIQVILPDWWIPTMEETIHFLRVVTEAAAPVGVVLYNPPHAKKRLIPAEWQQIRQAGIALVGCKVPGGDAAWYDAMRKMTNDFSLFVPGHHLASGIKQGAHGAYSNVACLHPQTAQQWYDSMHTDMDGALELEGRIQQFMNQHIVPFIRDMGYSNQAADKLLAAIGGWAHIGTRLRWPYKGISEDVVGELRRTCKNLLPEFFRTH